LRLLTLETHQPPPPSIQLGDAHVPIVWNRNPKARRYILRVKRPACLVATIPRGGSQRDAWAFIERSKSWIQQQLAKPVPPVPTETWFRGEKIPIVTFDLNVAKRLACSELTQRTHELAAHTNSDITKITIRNQRTRWGSCSRRRAISLNWRLIQTPPFVVDYIILHELMHLRQMNHSNRFWNEVEKVCPNWRDAERWLRKHGGQIIRG
jgi:predicted metal-dependent hydrolase